MPVDPAGPWPIRSGPFRVRMGQAPAAPRPLPAGDLAHDRIPRPHRSGDCPFGHHAAHRPDRRQAGGRSGGCGAVRQDQGQAVAGPVRPPRPAAPGPADPGHGHQPHPGRGRQDHHQRRPDRRLEPAGRLGGAVPAGAFPGALLRPQGRRRRRRPCPGGAHGGYQPALHRGLPRHRRGAQPAGGGPGQPPGARQPAGHRPGPDRLEAGRGHERPGPAPPRAGAGGAGQWPAAGKRLRDHRGLGGHGHLLPGRVPGGSARASGPDDRRLYLGPAAGHRRGPEGARGHDRPAQDGAPAQPGADPGAQPGPGARRALRQHRPRLQQPDRHPPGPSARPLCGHRGRLRRRSGRGEVAARRAWFRTRWCWWPPCGP